METIYLFISEVFISLVLSALSLWVLSKPLMNILTDLCPTQKQADFWQAYTRIMLSMSPLLLVLLVDTFIPSNDLLEHIRISLMAGLTGLLIGMIIVGKRIFVPASQLCDVNTNAVRAGELSVGPAK